MTKRMPTSDYKNYEKMKIKGFFVKPVDSSSEFVLPATKTELETMLFGTKATATFAVGGTLTGLTGKHFIFNTPTMISALWFGLTATAAPTIAGVDKLYKIVIDDTPTDAKIVTAILAATKKAEDFVCVATPATTDSVTFTSSIGGYCSAATAGDCPALGFALSGTATAGVGEFALFGRIDATIDSTDEKDAAKDANGDERVRSRTTGMTFNLLNVTPENAIILKDDWDQVECVVIGYDQDSFRKRVFGYKSYVLNVGDPQMFGDDAMIPVSCSKMSGSTARNWIMKDYESL